jgi:hypothetical protein
VTFIRGAILLRRGERLRPSGNQGPHGKDLPSADLHLRAVTADLTTVAPNRRSGFDSRRAFRTDFGLSSSDEHAVWRISMHRRNARHSAGLMRHRRATPGSRNMSSCLPHSSCATARVRSRQRANISESAAPETKAARHDPSPPNADETTTRGSTLFATASLWHRVARCERPRDGHREGLTVPRIEQVFGDHADLQNHAV